MIPNILTQFLSVPAVISLGLERAIPTFLTVRYEHFHPSDDLFRNEVVMARRKVALSNYAHVHLVIRHNEKSFRDGAGERNSVATRQGSK